MVVVVVVVVVVQVAILEAAMFVGGPIASPSYLRHVLVAPVCGADANPGPRRAGLPVAVDRVLIVIGARLGYGIP